MDSELINYFKNHYLSNQSNLKILNVGLYNFDSSLFDENNWNIDILDNISSDSVDIYVNDIYNWVEVPNLIYDVLICDNLSNLNYFWLILSQFEKVINYDGYLVLIVPNIKHIISDNLFYFSEDSLKFLAQYINFKVIEVISLNDNLCLIARKNSEMEFIINSSFENKTYKNRLNLILDEYDKDLTKIKRYNSQFDNTFIKVKSSLMNLSLGCDSYCPICKSKLNSFDSFGVPPRKNALCPICGALERDRLIFSFLEEKTDILTKSTKILHFSPSKSLINLFGNNKNFNNISSNIIDYQNNDYENNEFGCIFCVHILDKVENDIEFMRELYRIVKPSSEGGFLLVNVPLLRDVTFENEEYNTPELRLKYYHDKNRYRIYGRDIKERLESVGFTVEEYVPDDFLDSKLINLYGIIPDFLYLCRK